MRKYNATQLKYFMATLMVLDHIPHIHGLMSPLWEGIFHALTRCVGVWFAYMAVEGFIHTSNLKRYIIRLFSWSLFMATGNFLLNLVTASKDIYTANNIFLTLAIGVSMLAVAFPSSDSQQSKSGLRWIVAILLLVIGGLLTEGGTVLLPFMLITYACRKKIMLRNILYILLALCLFALAYTPYDTWQMTLEMLLYNSDFLFITVLPFMALYNGERGRNTKFNQYFFYIFYPAHLWIIAVLAYLIV